MSDELKPCPNPKCKGRRIDLRIEQCNAKTIVAWCQCLDCGVRGPASADISDQTSGPIAVANKRIAVDRWNALPRATGPGEATRRMMEAVRATVKASGLDPAKHVECGYLCRVRLDLDDIAAALRECGMEAGS